MYRIVVVDENFRGFILNLIVRWLVVVIEEK